MTSNQARKSDFRYAIARSSTSATEQTELNDDQYILRIWQLLNSARSLASPKTLSLVSYQPENKKSPNAEDSLGRLSARDSNVFSASRIKAAWRCLVHVPAVAITLVVLSLSWREVFWETPNNTTDSKLGALQFLAKVHEILIVLSLSHLAFDRVQLNLLSRAYGVPLGFLSAATMVDSAEYILSREFWSGLARNRRSMRKLGLGCFFLLLFALATVAGPASAIIMVPSLDWWSFPIDQMSQIFLSTMNLPVFPLNVIPDYITHGISNTAVTIFSYYEQHAFTDSDSYVNPVNISIGIERSQFQRQIVGAGLPCDSNSHYVSSTIPSFIAFDLAAVWHILRLVPSRWSSQKRVSVEIKIGASSPLERLAGNLKDKTIYKPLVQTECSSMNVAQLGSEIPSFPHNNLSQFKSGNQSSSDWRLPASMMAKLRRESNSLPLLNNKAIFHWVNMDFVGDIHPSIGAAWYGHTVDRENTLHLCTIDAKWVPVKVWIDPDMDSTVQEDSSNLTALTELVPNLSYNPIHISQDWASTMAAIGQDFYNSLTLPTTPTEYIFEQCVSGAFAAHNNIDLAQRVFSHCLGARLAPWIAESLANVQYGMMNLMKVPEFKANEDPWSSEPTSWAAWDIQDLLRPESIELPTPEQVASPHPFWKIDPANAPAMVPFYFTGQQYGYGYGWCSIITYIAAAILLLHTFLVLAHIANVICRRHNVCRSISDLNILAWNSRADPRLHGANFGMRDKRLWGNIVRLVAGEDGQLEFVMEDEESSLGSEAPTDKNLSASLKGGSSEKVAETEPQPYTNAATCNGGEVTRERPRRTDTPFVMQHPRRFGSEWI